MVATRDVGSPADHGSGLLILAPTPTA